jgi:mono/diheme cytochrome c family protein
MPFRTIAAGTLAILAIAGTLVTLGAQTKTTVWNGVYTEAQAARGKTAYDEHCASCHGTDLEGKDMAASLAGIEFRGNWNELSVGDLFDRIRATMPADAPQSLSRAQYLDIVAYLLSRNEFPTGTTELPTDDTALKAVQIAATRP